MLASVCMSTCNIGAATMTFVAVTVIKTYSILCNSLPLMIVNWNILVRSYHLTTLRSTATNGMYEGNTARATIYSYLTRQTAMLKLYFHPSDGGT